MTVEFLCDPLIIASSCVKEELLNSLVNDVGINNCRHEQYFANSNRIIREGVGDRERHKFGSWY